MKVSDILYESHANERIISALADAIATNIMDGIKNGTLPSMKLGDHEIPHTGVIGTVAKLAGSKLTGSLYNRLGKVKVEVFNSKASNNAGEAQQGMVAVNTHALRSKTKLASTLVHELKHVLEYSQTKGDHKGMTSKHKETNEPDSQGDQDHTKQYHRRRTEINARLSQAMKGLTAELDKVDGKKITNEQLSELIFKQLSKYELQMIFKSGKSTIMSSIFGSTPPPKSIFHPTDNKYYQKLISRLYSYAKEHIDRVQ